jgi:hypothetical protein
LLASFLRGSGNGGFETRSRPRTAAQFCLLTQWYAPFEKWALCVVYASGMRKLRVLHSGDPGRKMGIVLGVPMDYRKPAAITTAALIAGLAVSQPAAAEPHTHDGEAAPSELILCTGFGASGGFTNTTAAVTRTSSYSWALPSSSATFERDVDFASRMRGVGIMVYVLTPAG